MSLQTLYIPYTTQNEAFSGSIPVSFEVFGPPLGSAPVVVINHTLTGNSTVTGPNGWWNALVGEGRCIDTRCYTVLAFNSPGNGYDGFLLEDPEAFSVYDVATLFLKGLQQLQVTQVYALLGGSLGGGVAWQMAVLRPSLFEHLIPIATDWKATDWLLAQCSIQKQLLAHADRPVHEARRHAMTLYRSPQSFKHKFNRAWDEKTKGFQVHSWLHHHGRSLENRFEKQAYQAMNHLLSTLNITKTSGHFLATVRPIAAAVHLIGVDSDLLFPNQEIEETYRLYKTIKKEVYHHTLHSIHGHDAFLMEIEQLETLLQPVFKKKTTYEYPIHTAKQTSRFLSVD